MTTITLDNPKIENKYSSYELQMKFLAFMEIEIKDESIDLYQINVNDLSNKSKERLINIDTLNFVNY